MYKMDQWNFPQWTDFTSTPPPLCEDYFDYEHKELERHLNDCEEFEASSSVVTGLDKSRTGSVPVASPTPSTSKIVTSKVPSKKEDTEDVVNINLKTPVTVMPLMKKHRNSTVANKSTYEDILADAMSNSKLLSCKRKSRRSHNLSIYKPSSSIKLQPKKYVAITPAETETVSDAVDESRKQDKPEVENITKPVKSIVTSSFNKGSIAHLRKSVAKPTLLTCKYRRYSLSKNRTSTNQYISLAEAVNKFQNQTPKRFRTVTTKNKEPGPLAKTKQRLKLTEPISPVLLSKTRVRTNVFATSNRDIHGKAIPSNEANQKNKCKAKPVDLRTSKPPVLQTSNTSQLTVKKRVNKITMPIIESNQSQPSGYSFKKVEISNFGVRPINTHKKSTSAVPFSFEAREKERRKKRAEKLEKLQAEKENRRAAPIVHTGATDTKLLPKNLHVAPPTLKTDRRAKESLASTAKRGALLQKMAEPKARPMPVYKAVAIMKSNKPLTVPQSPAWAAKAKH